MVLIKELERQHEEAQNDRAGGSPGTVNQMKSPGGGGTGETTVYTNDGDEE
jgi:hypothetical protein